MREKKEKNSTNVTTYVERMKKSLIKLNVKAESKPLDKPTSLHEIKTSRKDQSKK